MDTTLSLSQMPLDPANHGNQTKQCRIKNIPSHLSNLVLANQLENTINQLYKNHPK
jgi:hypothetical protein